MSRAMRVQVSRASPVRGVRGNSRRPSRVTGEGVVVEEPEPVVDAVLGHRLHRDGADLRESFCRPGDSLGRLAVVPGVVPDRLLGVRPTCGSFARGPRKRRRRRRRRPPRSHVTPEAFDLHGFLPLRALPGNGPARVPARSILTLAAAASCGARRAGYGEDAELSSNPDGGLQIQGFEDATIRDSR